MNNKEKEEILQLFKDELEKNYEHNSKEYHEGMRYYFKLKECKTIDELNCMYELFGNEYFKSNNPKISKK